MSQAQTLRKTQADPAWRRLVGQDGHLGQNPLAQMLRSKGNA